MEKIRWNFDEINAVASATKTFWSTAPGMTMLEAIRGGQNTLPKERRRSIATAQQITPRLKLDLDRFVAAGGLNPKPAEPEKPAAPVEPPKPVVTPLDTALHELADSAADLLSERIYKRLHQSLAQRVEGILQHVAHQATQVDVVKKRKVLIIGLAEYLQHPIEQEFSKLLDIRFRGPDAPINGLVDTAKSMDFVIQTKWTGHKVSDALNAANIAYTFVDGGIQTIKERLTEFYVL